jgi:nucleotide-binding universal stress UspA family protein
VFARTDAEIASDVAIELRRSGQVPDDDVSASVDDGVVSLTGRVADPGHVPGICRVAWLVPNVVDVVVSARGRRADRDGMTDIVVGVDGSPNSVAALRWAHAEARRRGDHLVALFAWAFVQPGHAGADHTFDPSYDASRATTVFAAAVEDALGPDAAGIVEHRIPHEPAPGALLEAAADAELLVVGARGAGGLHGLLLGSVSQQLLHRTRGHGAVTGALLGSVTHHVTHHAPGPVVVVP